MSLPSLPMREKYFQSWRHSAALLFWFKVGLMEKKMETIPVLFRVGCQVRVLKFAWAAIRAAGLKL